MIKSRSKRVVTVRGVAISLSLVKYPELRWMPDIWVGHFKIDGQGFRAWADTYKGLIETLENKIPAEQRASVGQ